MFPVVGFFGFASSEMEEIVLIHDLKALIFFKKIIVSFCVWYFWLFWLLLKGKYNSQADLSVLIDLLFFSLSPEAALRFFSLLSQVLKYFSCWLWSRLYPGWMWVLLNICFLCPLPCHLTSRCYFSLSHVVPSALSVWPWGENAHDFRHVSFICLLFWAILTSDYF